MGKTGKAMSANRLLIEACRNGSKVNARTAVKQGANANAFDPQTGLTPLQIACANNNFEIVIFLLTRIPDIDINNLSKDGSKNALYIASAYGLCHMVDVLLQLQADPNVVVNEADPTPLHAASRINHLEILNLLLNNGANPNLPMETVGCPLTPLMIACRCGYLEAALLLIQRGDARINIPELDGKFWQPLHFAVDSGNLDVVMSMLSYGADVWLTESSASTPFTFACENGYCNIVQFILETFDSPELIEYSDAWCVTPLMKACFRGHFSVAKLLIEQGADIHRKNKYGSDAFDCTIDSNNININLMVYLLKAGAFPRNCSSFTSCKATAPHAQMSRRYSLMHSLPLRAENVGDHVCPTSLAIPLTRIPLENSGTVKPAMALSTDAACRIELMKVLIFSGFVCPKASDRNALISSALTRFIAKPDEEIRSIIRMFLSAGDSNGLNLDEIPFLYNEHCYNKAFFYSQVRKLGLFPMRLDDMCRIEILSYLPRGYVQRMAAIESELSEYLPLYICDFLKFSTATE